MSRAAAKLTASRRTPQQLAQGIVCLLHLQTVLPVQDHQQNAAQPLLDAVVLTADIPLAHLVNQVLGKAQQDALHFGVVVEAVEHHMQAHADRPSGGLHHALVGRAVVAQQQVQTHQSFAAHHGDFCAVAVFEQVLP
jgi:hypothetical protein